MNIGLVLDRFDPRLGGVEQWTLQFARWLLATGHRVHVAASAFGPAACELPIVRHEVSRCRSRSRYAAALEATLAPLRLDVVHDMGSGWFADVVQPHGGSRQASFEQNLLLLPPWLRPAKRLLAPLLPRYREFNELSRRQLADDGRLIVAISDMVADHLQRFHGVPARQIRRVYNGVDLLRFSPAHREAHRLPIRAQLGVADHELLLLIVAHNFPLKGVPTLIRAAGRLHKSGHPLRLAVAGNKRNAAAARLAGRCGIADRVHFLGPVDDPVPYYAAADAYVQPTFYDPCSLVVLEALASGLPTVTSRFNGAGELLTPGKDGLLLHDPADDAELAATLEPLWNAVVREQMGRAARRLAEKHSLERNCREILAVYGEQWSRRAAA